MVRKLLWFQQGGESSSTQWRDIVQILRLAAGELDMSYIRLWSKSLNLDGLLARALVDSA